MTSKPSLLGHTADRLAAELAEWRLAAYRHRQIVRAVHERGVADFASITDLPLELRERLAAEFTLERPTVLERLRSGDGTLKYLFRAGQEARVECVDIPDGSRRTVCISSQAGCALGCRFCVTGVLGAGRSLSSAEIVGQVYAARELGTIPDGALNLVFMGMGEPLLNLSAVREALGLLSIRIPWRRMTVSTAGVVPGIDEMATWSERPNLAISLHAPDDARRSELMPINRRYPLGRLLEALRSYPSSRQRPLLVEYTLIRSFNDRRDDPRLLARLLAGLRVKVNLIPLNPDPVLPREMEPTPWSRIESMQRELVRLGLPTSVRRPRGTDISAACGQLRSASQRRSSRLEIEPVAR